MHGFILFKLISMRLNAPLHDADKSEINLLREAL